MFVDVQAGTIAFASAAGAIPGGTSGSGGAGPVSARTTNYTIPAGSSENGTLYTNYPTLAAVQINLPADAKLGDTYTFYAGGASGNFVIKAPTGQVLQYGGLQSSSGGTQSNAGNGASICYKYISTNLWGCIFNAGSYNNPV